MFLNYITPHKFNIYFFVSIYSPSYSPFFFRQFFPHTERPRPPFLSFFRHHLPFILILYSCLILSHQYFPVTLILTQLLLIPPHPTPSRLSPLPLTASQPSRHHSTSPNIHSRPKIQQSTIFLLEQHLLHPRFSLFHFLY